MTRTKSVVTKQRQEAVAHETVPQIEIGAGDQHEGEGDRQALVGHVGVEGDARHGHVDGAADREHDPEQGMQAQQVAARGPDRAGDDDRQQSEGGKVGIDFDGVDQAVDLAEPLPIVVGGKPHGRAQEQQRQRGQERNAGGDEVEEAARPAARRAAPTAGSFRRPAGRRRTRRAPTDGRRTAAARKPGETAKRSSPVALAQIDPGRQRPQRQADAEQEIGQPDQEDVVIEQREGEQRKHRPAAEQRAVERQGSRHDQREHHDQEDLAGVIDRDHAREHRDDEVHHQVGDHLPVDLVEARQIGVAADRRNHLHAREVIDVVRQGRQRVGPDRDRGHHQHQAGQHGDLARRENQGAPARRGKPRRERPHHVQIVGRHGNSIANRA